MQTPHDRFFRRVFADPEHAAGELRALLPPALGARLDWSSLTAAALVVAAKGRPKAAGVEGALGRPREVAPGAAENKGSRLGGARSRPRQGAVWTGEAQVAT